MQKKHKRIVKNTNPYHLCFKIGNKYYLMNLMEGTVSDDSFLGKLMRKIDSEMKRDGELFAAG